MISHQYNLPYPRRLIGPKSFQTVLCSISCVARFNSISLSASEWMAERGGKGIYDVVGTKDDGR